MAEEKFTRCPGCSTIFRVIPQQLALRAGQVRCGHCQTVFDGVASLVQAATFYKQHWQPGVDLNKTLADAYADFIAEKSKPSLNLRPRTLVSA